MSNFEINERIIAVSPSSLEEIYPRLLNKYGKPLPDGERTIVTIGAHWDDADKTRIRAASLSDGTIIGQPLADGRLAFICLWQADLAKAFEQGLIEGVEELTPEQYEAALPPTPARFLAPPVPEGI